MTILPVEIYRKIYSYLFDLSEIKYIKNKYTHNDNNKNKENFNDSFRYYFSKHYIILGYDYWQKHFITLPSFISCYRFHKNYSGANSVYDYPLEFVQ